MYCLIEFSLYFILHTEKVIDTMPTPWVRVHWPLSSSPVCGALDYLQLSTNPLDQSFLRKLTEHKSSQQPQMDCIQS